MIFTGVATYLIYDTIYTFAVQKPTYTSQEERNLNAKDFPEIFLCPEPAVDVDVLKSYGYSSYHEYFKGITAYGVQDPKLTWAGNNSEDITKVANAISTLNSSKDCPNAIFKFHIGSGSIKIKTAFDKAEYIIEKSMDPHHTCCRIIPSKLSKTFPVNFLKIHFPESLKAQNFKVFMADNLAASYFDQQKYMLGDKIVSSRNSMKLYKINVLEENKLENDPKNPCNIYNIKGEYAECIENEIIQQNLNFLNCTPPWMTEKEDMWCRGKVNEPADYKFRDFVDDIQTGEANYGKCLVPCNVKMYQSKELGQLDQNARGLMIKFGKKVFVSKTSLAVDEVTLLSKIGGTIGMSKSLLWLIILIISSVGVIMSRLKLNKLPPGCS